MIPSTEIWRSCLRQSSIENLCGASRYVFDQGTLLTVLSERLLIRCLRVECVEIEQSFLGADGKRVGPDKSVTVTIKAK